MAHSVDLLAISTLALLLVASATPTRGNPAEPRHSEIPINFTFYSDQEHDTYRKECSAECGIRGGSRAANPDDKIVGGEDAEKDEFPWRCLLTLNTPELESSYCGCTILSENWVMTAAHCTYNLSNFEVFAGLLDYTHKQSADYRSGADVQVFNHPSYNLRNLDNVALWEDPTTFTVSGWGARYRGDGSPATVLQKLDNLPFLPNEQCRENYDGRHEITDNMVCTYEAGIDTCQGDSGGSLDYLDYDGRYKAMGVVSWGDGCAEKGNPGVYAWVITYLRWIEETTGRVFCG